MKNFSKLLLAGFIGLLFAACSNTPDYVGNYKFSGTAVTTVTRSGAEPQIATQTLNGTFTLSLSGDNYVIISGDMNLQGTIKDNAIVVEPTHVEQSMSGMKQTVDNTIEPIQLGGISLHVVSHSTIKQEMNGELVQTTKLEEDYTAVKL